MKCTLNFRVGSSLAWTWACVGVCAGVCLAGGAVAAAEPVLERSDLFVAGKDGYGLYRIPGIVVTKSGVLLAYCEARRTGRSDWDTIDLMMRRSTNGGRNWTEATKFVEVPGPKGRNPAIAGYKLARPDDLTYNNPVAIAARSGAVHLLFCLEYMRCFYVQSGDDGVTWTKPIEITSAFAGFRPEWDWKILATGPGHAIELQNGRLIVPVWLSTGTGGGNAHRPSVTSTLYSDDAGQTWRAGQIAIPNQTPWINPNEAVLVQLVDGRVLLNVRNESNAHRRLITTSADGATRWSTPQFDQALVEPICMASIIRLSAHPSSNKNRILFANPDNLSREDGKETPGLSRDRKNLSIKLSYDEGVTWPVNKVLEPGLSSYSDLAVTTNGWCFCFYERNRSQQLTLARFNLEWLTEGKDGLR